MKHMDRAEALIERLLNSMRTIAVIGASPRPTRHSNTVVRYLHKAGYDVIPVRPDRATVGDLPTYGRLEDVAGPVDLVVIFRRPDAGIVHVREAVAKRAEAVWFQPGAWSREAEDEARRQELTVVKDRCIMEDHRHLLGAVGEAGAGHPQKTGVHVRRRKRTFEDNRRRPEDDGYVAGGGGGHSAGGGVRAVVDEKKMTKGRPSPRLGPFKHKPT
jgi:predicted CoA-binding protein